MRGPRLDRHASITAQFNAAQRAAESLQLPDRRLLDDAYARAFVTHPALRLLIAHRLVATAALKAIDAFLPGLHAHIVLRARYADDAVRTAVGDGIEQLVLLGAGFDSTAFRLDGPPVGIFEVDAPSTQRAKRQAIARVGAASPHRVAWVACDLERDDLKARLEGAGFRPDQRTLVVWLGVTFYLTSDALTAALEGLAELCTPGSRVVLDYGDPELVTGTSRYRAGRRATRLVARRGEPYRTGFTPNELAIPLRAAGFELRDHARVPDLASRYAPTSGVWCSADDWLGIATAERIPAPRRRPASIAYGEHSRTDEDSRRPEPSPARSASP